MKKILSIAVLSLILFSCGQKKKEPVSFQKIDVTVQDSWGRKYSLKTDSTGNTTTSVDDKKSDARERSFVLASKFLDSISFVAGKIDVAKIDTFYGERKECLNCVGYKFKMEKNGKSYYTTVRKISAVPEAAKIDSLAELIYTIVRTADLHPESVTKKQ